MSRRVVVGSSSSRRRVVGSLIPCLWGKLQSLSFSKVSTQVVMWFCVAGVALCDIPTCLITCRKCQSWRKSRTKCSFCCAHVSRLESLVFLWRRRVYGGVSKQVVMSFCVASVALCDIPTCLITCRKCQNWRKSRTKCSFCCAHVSRLESLVFLWRRRVYGGSCKTSFSKVSKQLVMSFCVANTLHTPHSSFHTLHSTLHTLHSTLHTLHFTLYTLHSTLHTLHLGKSSPCKHWKFQNNYFVICCIFCIWVCHFGFALSFFCHVLSFFCHLVFVMFLSFFLISLSFLWHFLSFVCHFIVILGTGKGKKKP